MNGIDHVFEARFEQPAIRRVLRRAQHQVDRSIEFRPGMIEIPVPKEFSACPESFLRLLDQKV